MRSSGALGLAVAAISIACVNRAATPASAVRDHWYAIETPHVHLETDLDRFEAVERATALERELETLAYLYRQLAPRPMPALGAVRVVLFDDCDAFRRLARVRDGVAGITRRSLDLDDALVVVTCDDVVYNERFEALAREELFRHELAHVLNAYYFGSLPAWLNEGLAEYFEGLRIVDESLVEGAGREPVLTAAATTPGTWRVRGRGDVLELGHPPATWLYWDDRDNAADITLDDVRGGAWVSSKRTYHAAWKAVHALFNASPAARERAIDFLARLGDGATEADAWAATIAPVEASVRATFAGWRPTAAYLTWKMPLPSFTAFEARVSTMSAVEIAALLVELAAPAGRARIAPALRDALANLDRVDRVGDVALLWRALVAHHTGDRSFGVARELFAAYVARRPDDRRGHLGRFLASIDGASEDELVALEPSVDRLAPFAGGAPTLDAIARYWRARGRLDAASTFVERALARDPSCWRCHETRAAVLHAGGWHADAIAAQRRAIALFGSSRAPPEMRSRLETYVTSGLSADN